MALEFYFAKIVPSPSETTPAKSFEEAFESRESKSDPNTRLVHCFKVVGEHAVVAVVQASSAEQADKFISTFSHDSPLIGQGRFFDITCNQLISYDDLLDKNETIPNSFSTPIKGDKVDSSSVIGDQTEADHDLSDAVSGTSKDGEKEGPVYWVEVETAGSAGGNASMFSQFVKNDVIEAEKKLATDGAKVEGYKVIGEKKFQYFISGVGLKDLEVVMDSMPIMSMPTSKLSCRRVSELKFK